MIDYEYAVGCLRKALDDPDACFKDGQWEAIVRILEKKRTLVVQPTGWGKSMIYFLSSKFIHEDNRGMTILISPLISLMRNQVLAANRVGVNCKTINSSNEEERSSIVDEILNDKVDLLLITPERLAKEDFIHDVISKIANNVGLLVIDEAHCVSDWGHDFRPDYRRISKLITALPPNIPVLATTATANSRVVDDINEQLGGNFSIQRGNLVRKSLFLQNIKLDTQEQRLAWIVDFISTKAGGPGIIYTLTTRDAKTVSKFLRNNGIVAYAYWADATVPEDADPKLITLLNDPEWKSWDDAKKKNEYRKMLEQLLLDNKIQALVATTALGMGFDKPDLSFVIHYQRPKSVVDYYQQVGRAGRAIDHAYGVLLNGLEDDEIADYFIEKAFPAMEEVREVLQCIKASRVGISLKDLEKSPCLSKIETNSEGSTLFKLTSCDTKIFYGSF